MLQACGIVLAAAAWHPAARAIGLGEERIVTLRSTVRGTVTALDVAGRRLKMRGPEGEATYRLDPRVPELAQVRVGDEVRLDSVAAVGLTLRRGSGPSPKKAGNRALLDGAGAGKPVTALTRVLAVDPESRNLRVRGPTGQETEFQVDDPSDLHGVRVGDQMVAVIYELVAVNILPPAR